MTIICDNAFLPTPAKHECQAPKIWVPRDQPLRDQPVRVFAEARVAEVKTPRIRLSVYEKIDRSHWSRAHATTRSLLVQPPLRCNNVWLSFILGQTGTSLLKCLQQNMQTQQNMGRSSYQKKF